jgi:tripartite motif-containing protein 71
LQTVSEQRLGEINMKTSKFLLIRAHTLLVFLVCGLAGCTASTPIATTELPTPVEPSVTPIGSITTSDTGQVLTLIWQSEFSADGAIGAAVDLAVDSQGNVYVSTENIIKKFDSQGNFLMKWGGAGVGEGEFILPTGVAVDAQDNVYVADFSNRRVQKFDSRGKFLMQWPTDRAGNPGSLGVDNLGNVYVSIFQTIEDHVQKFDDAGHVLSTWGPIGTEDGQFANRTEDMFTDQDGNVYVSDPPNHRIQKFDSNGNFLNKFGGDASKDGKGLFDQPVSSVVDAEGNIYVLDGHFLQKLDSNGNFIMQWPITTENDLDRAGFVTMDRQGDIYILAHANLSSAAGGPADAIVVKKFHLP